MLKRLFPLLLVFGALLVSCREKAEPAKAPTAASAPSAPSTKEAIPPFKPRYNGGTPEDQVKNTVVRYNELVSYGYRNLDMTPLQEVATQDQAEKAYIHMAAIGEGTARMISTLKRIDFDPFSAAGGKVRVNTREVWDFLYVDIKTGVKKGEEKDFVYLVSYALEPAKGGGWTITDITATSNEKSRPVPAPRRIVPGLKKEAPGAMPPGMGPNHGAAPAQNPGPGPKPKPGQEPGF